MACIEFQLIMKELRFQHTCSDPGFGVQGPFQPPEAQPDFQFCPMVLKQYLTLVCQSFAAGNKWIDVLNLGLPLIWPGKSQTNI